MPVVSTWTPSTNLSPVLFRDICAMSCAMIVSLQLRAKYPLGLTRQKTSALSVDANVVGRRRNLASVENVSSP